MSSTLLERVTEPAPNIWLKKYLKQTGLQNNKEAYMIFRLANTKIGHNALGQIFYFIRNS